jgi:hypothetical protein
MDEETKKIVEENKFEMKKIQAKAYTLNKIITESKTGFKLPTHVLKHVEDNTSSALKTIIANKGIELPGQYEKLMDMTDEMFYRKING